LIGWLGPNGFHLIFNFSEGGKYVVIDGKTHGSITSTSPLFYYNGTATARPRRHRIGHGRKRSPWNGNEWELAGSLFSNYSSSIEARFRKTTALSVFSRMSRDSQMELQTVAHKKF